MLLPIHASAATAIAEPAASPHAGRGLCAIRTPCRIWIRYKYFHPLGSVDLAGIIASLGRSCADLEGEFDGEFLGLMLFGSWARGEAREDSDVDVLVLFDGLAGDLDVRARAYGIIRRYVDRDVTLITMRREDIHGRWTPLAINIAWDGVIVCDRQGELRWFKEAVASFIERENLVRYRTRDGKYGWERADGKPLIRAVRDVRPDR
jgi:predicted nucleotidyltransferase